MRLTLNQEVDGSFPSSHSNTCKTCTRCKIVKSVDDFSKKSSKLQNVCKECHRKYCADHYKKNKKYYFDRNKKKIQRVRKQISEIKKVPCMDCGIKYHYCVMDFDHVRGIKKFNIGSHEATFSIKKLQNEVKKCDIVCSNCHRIRTFNRRIKKEASMST